MNAWDTSLSSDNGCKATLREEELTPELAAMLPDAALLKKLKDHRMKDQAEVLAVLKEVRLDRDLYEEREKTLASVGTRESWNQSALDATLEKGPSRYNPPKFRHPLPDPERLTPYEFIVEFGYFLRKGGVPQHLVLTALKECATPTLLDAIEEREEELQGPWTHIRTEVLQMLEPGKSIEHYEDEFSRIRPHPGEYHHEYARRFRNLADLLGRPDDASLMRRYLFSMPDEIQDWYRKQRAGGMAEPTSASQLQERIALLYTDPSEALVLKGTRRSQFKRRHRSPRRDDREDKRHRRSHRRESRTSERDRHQERPRKIPNPIHRPSETTATELATPTSNERGIPAAIPRGSG